MASRKLTTNPRPTRSDFSDDFAGKPYRVAFSYVARCHVVVEVATDDAVEVEGAQAAYELAAALNYQAAQAQGEIATLALEDRAAGYDAEAALAEERTVIAIETAAELTPAQRAEYTQLTARFYARAEAGASVEELRALYEQAEAIRWGRPAVAEAPCKSAADSVPWLCPRCESTERVYINGAFRCLCCGADVTADVQQWAAEQADRDAEAELDRIDAELSARCACYATGTEQQACLDAGYPVCERETRRARWLARQKQMRETARRFGLLGTIAPPVPMIVPDAHPSPEMPLTTLAAIWDARSAALASVADALRAGGELPRPGATAHVSLTRRIELRRGQYGLLAVEIAEDAQGYESRYLRPFADEGEGRQWISDEAARRAGAQPANAA